jgi:hypothetical protein
MKIECAGYAEGWKCLTTEKFNLARKWLNGNGEPYISPVHLKISVQGTEKETEE